MNDPWVILQKPVITERTSLMQEESGKYVFEVLKTANKIQIKDAVESMFEVEVAKVNTSSVRGKIKRMGKNQGRRRSWKKAVVTLAEGHTIDFFESV